MTPRVSIIVPVYGSEAFLPECIASLRAQTLKDLEIIFVCDASPDQSLGPAARSAAGGCACARHRLLGKQGGFCGAQRGH